MDVIPQSRTRRVVTSVTIGILSLLFALAGTALTAWIADRFNLCCVHGWALAHGSGVIVLMAWGLLGFHFVSALAARQNPATSPGRFGILPHLTYISAALGSLFITEYFMWVGFVAGAIAIIMRSRGNPTNPFGLALVGFLVSLVGVAQWLYMQWLFHGTHS